jgi:acylphosphatase
MGRARFVVHGSVQGVNFRATAVREALRLAITGRVWNRDDGAVELIAEGSGGALASLQNWLNEGPPGADVREVERTELGGKQRYEGFNIAWSAPKWD